jgi:hypothetical protein
MGRLALVFIVLISSVYATTYSSSSIAIASSKDDACKLALNIAREDALSQAGTLVISDYQDSTKIVDKKYSNIKSKQLQNIAIGTVKVLEKSENIKVTKDYLFRCKVTATFEIDEDNMKKAIGDYIKDNKKNTVDKTIYIQSTGYCADGQSAYRAIKSAMLDAKRNLLDEIKGSILISTTTSKDGSMQMDQVINNIHSSIRYVKIISKDYDPKTQSAKVVVGLTKEDFDKNIKRWESER